MVVKLKVCWPKRLKYEESLLIVLFSTNRIYFLLRLRQPNTIKLKVMVLQLMILIKPVQYDYCFFGELFFLDFFPFGGAPEPELLDKVPETIYMFSVSKILFC